MPFNILPVVIGLIVGALSCYLGWKGLTVWLNETPVESNLLKSLKKMPETIEVLRPIALLVSCFAIISGAWLILMAALMDGKVMIDMPMGAILVLAGWRLCQKKQDNNIQAIGFISVLIGGFFIVAALISIAFKLFFWKFFYFGF